ncbi:MAG TPA: enoyl-CoA hydratase/isomerase family protein [Xanthobacteraceae bacterium]|jgi:enoyl-CoA hydratase
MTRSTVRYELADGIATITLNRPDSRNALNRAMCEDLLAAAAAATADDAGVVLVRGAGPVFCAGADLKERKDMSIDEVRNRRLRGFAAYCALEALPMPTIAVVHGAAIGSGSEIAAACDFIVATPEATFSTPEALWGTVGATQRLARVLGKRLAKDLMFTGRKLTAEEARIAGLVARVVAADKLEAALSEITATIAKASAAGLRLAKRCIDQGSELDPRGALAVELMAIEENLAQDARAQESQRQDGWRARMGAFKGATRKA